MADKNNRGRVAIISRESDERTLDIALLEDELIRRGIETETLTKLFTKDKSLGSAAGYLGTVAAQEKAILRADVIVLDTYVIPVSMLPHKSSTRVIQMWHALSAVKKFGWQTVGTEDGTSERTARMMRMHSGYDYVLCSSDVTAEHFAEAFRIDKGKIVKLGLPRIDYIRSAVSGDGRYRTYGAIYALYPELAASDKKIVLYVPTFRKSSMPDVKGLADALDPDKYFLIVKLHPLYRGEGELPQADNIIYAEDIPGTRLSSFDLLGIADVIISDYSSMVVEATLADKPMYLYTYDIDTYSETTGLNMDFASEPIGKYVFRDAGELARAIDRQLADAETVAGRSKSVNADAGEKDNAGKDPVAQSRDDGSDLYDMTALRAFRDKYIDINTDDCTGQLADFIESLLPGTSGERSIDTKRAESDMETEPNTAQSAEETVVMTGLKEHNALIDVKDIWPEQAATDQSKTATPTGLEDDPEWRHERQ